MSDLTNRVKTVFSADTSQAKAAVQSLRGVERDRAKELLDNLNRENAQLESSIKTWAKVGAIVGGAALAMKGFHDATQNALEGMRLDAAAAGASIEGLRKATHGLAEQDKLLEFAGRTMHGTWKLNQVEMEAVLQGAMAIRKETGEELVPVMDKLTEAFAKGSTKSLKEFGITATTEAGVIEQLRRKVARLGGDTSIAGDDVQAGGVKVADAMDHMSEAIGRLVIQLTPLINKMADFVEEAAAVLDVISHPKDAAGATVGLLGDIVKTQAQFGVSQDVAISSVGQSRFEAAYHKAKAKSEMETLGYFFGNGWILDAQDALAAGVTKVVKDYKKPKKHGRGGELGYAPDLIEAGQDIGRTFLGAAQDVGSALRGTYDQTRADQYQQLGNGAMSAGDKRFGEEMAGIKQDWLERGAADKLLAAQAEAEKHKKLFESVFGSPDEISAIAVGLDLARTAVDGVTGAIASSFEAWVTGAESAGEVFKRAVAGVVHSLGVELAQVAAKHLVLAGVSAVTLDFAGAGRHAAAAALAGAGAAGMFLVAQQMGYGASKPSAPSAAAGHALGGGVGGVGGGKSGDQTTIIYLTPDWDDETPSQRRQKLARAVRRGGVNRTSNIVLNR